MEEFPQRISNRLTEFDYSQNGAYFVTICTKNMQNLFWNECSNDYEIGTDSVGANSVRPFTHNVVLSDIGKFVNEYILKIPTIYKHVQIDKYVIMPNHIHMIIIINGDDSGNGRTMFAPTNMRQRCEQSDKPTISRIIKHMKSKVSKQIGYSIWQRSYYDHIIRNQLDYERIWQYIDNNPSKWELDEYYVK